MEWTRRNLFPLALLAAVLPAAGCSDGGSGGADDRIRQTSADRAGSLAGLYAQARSARSADPRFAAFEQHHLAHRALLLSGASNPATADPAIPAVDQSGDPSSAAASASAHPGSLPSSQPSAGAIPPTAASLVAAERSASTAAGPDLTAASGKLAGLLADIAACRAVHCAALDSATAQIQATAAAAPQISLPTQDDVAAAQTILSAEHAAVYAYGALTPHLRGTQRDEAHGLYELHRQLRDDLETGIAAHGATPAAMVAAYAFPEQPTDPANAAALAGYVETRVAAVCANAVAAATAAGRPYAAWSVVNASLRAYAWGRPPVAFPATFSA